MKGACLSGLCFCGFGKIIANTAAGSSTVKSDSEPDNDYLLMQQWLTNLLVHLEEEDKDSLRAAIKKSAKIHYAQLKMDETLAAYENKIESFNQFLQEKWGWKINFDPKKKVMIADENKNFCVCPMAKGNKKISRMICYCSEGFAELMYSKVFGKKVRASVISSIQRGDKTCQYKIEWD